MGGLWLVGAGRWQRFAVAMLGFVLARLVVVRVAGLGPRRMNPQEQTAPSTGEEH